MPPKKTVVKTEKVTKGRTPKAKEVKEKRRLKTPTVVKIKLPVKNLSRTIQNITTPNSEILDKKAKNLTESEKLELANSVARAQLNKAPIFSSPPPPQPTSQLEQNDVKTVRKRGRRKKDNEETPQVTEKTNSPITISTDNEEVNVQPPKRKYVRKPVPKLTKEMPMTPQKKMAVNLALNPLKKITGRPVKRKLVSPTDETKNPPKRRWTQSRITEMKILVRRNSKASSNADIPRTVTVAKPKLASKRNIRGKKSVENVAESVQGQPSNTKQVPQEMPISSIKKEDDKFSKNAGAIDSRKTSVNSELSWTKDISDSSNTTSITAITSSDFVLIDKKLPEMRLTKIDSIVDISKPVVKEFTPRTPSNSSSSSSDSDSSDSESIPNSNSFKGSDIVSRHSLNLSTSSESHRSPIITQKNISINTMNNNLTKINNALDKLSLSLKKIDLEMINWVGYQNEDINTNGKKLSDKIRQNLKEESNIILQCRHISKVLSDNEEVTNKGDNVTRNSEDQSNEAFVKPSDVVVPKTLNKSSEHSNLDKGNHSRDQTDFSVNKYDIDYNFTSNNIPYKSFDQSFDDEDALSLYAESIGFESNRNSISSPPLFNPEIEEYIPQPVRNVLPAAIVYNPTKINNATQSKETTPNVRSLATVCEKQNADSTSVVKETNQGIQIEGIEKLPEPKIGTRPVEIQVKKGPCLLSTIFKPSPGIRSVVFKGFCFFHLISSCKNQLRCRFPHIEPAPIEICAKLTKLSEDLFIQEYMLLKCWPALRRKYGICFVDECKRRDLTRLLVEMAIDFVMKANLSSQEDAALRVHVLEEALLHLNNIDLMTCEDLLKYVIQGKHLCDLFMETIANTQNFTRFKPVFIKLTQFVIDNKKVFSVDVATHILERVAILPFNESLAWALLSIIKHTDAVIFDNSMMAQFEKQLCSNEGLHREFLAVKKMSGLGQPTGNQVYETVAPPLMRLDEERPISSPLYPNGVQRYTSPDTTHLDTMNKPPDEPIITRTINFDRTLPNYSSSSSESTDEHPRTPKPNSLFNSWRNKSIFNKFSPHRFPNNRRNDRQVTYGGNSSKFPRRPGPDFF